MNEKDKRIRKHTSKISPCKWKFELHIEHKTEYLAIWRRGSVWKEKREREDRKANGFRNAMVNALYIFRTKDYLPLCLAVYRTIG